MQTHTLLSLGTFVGLSTSLAVYALTGARKKYIVSGSDIGNAPIDEKDSNKNVLKIFLPNTLARWPWPARVNPYHTEVTRESAAWMESFNAFSPKAQDAFNRCVHAHCATLVYPSATKENFRTSCDYMNLTFFIDEVSDMAEPAEAKKQKDIIMDALRNPHKPRPKGEWVGGEMARQFWEMGVRNASQGSQKRFIDTFDEYLEGVVQQAVDRSGHRIREIKDYFDVRRQTVAMTPAYALLELTLDIPDDVISHPLIQAMTWASIDMIILDNDMASYNVEQARGDDGHNIIRIVMDELGTDVNGAMLWAQDLHTKLEQNFLDAMAALPEWDEPLNSQVKEYCHGMAQWVRGYYDWQFETERYFGNRGAVIKEKRWMALLPKVYGRSFVGPVRIDGALLESVT